MRPHFPSAHPNPVREPKWCPLAATQILCRRASDGGTLNPHHSLTFVYSHIMNLKHISALRLEPLYESERDKERVSLPHTIYTLHANNYPNRIIPPPDAHNVHALSTMGYAGLIGFIDCENSRKLCLSHSSRPRSGSTPGPYIAPPTTAHPKMHMHISRNQRRLRHATLRLFTSKFCPGPEDHLSCART